MPKSKYEESQQVTASTMDSHVETWDQLTNSLLM